MMKLIIHFGLIILPASCLGDEEGDASFEYDELSVTLSSSMTSTGRALPISWAYTLRASWDGYTPSTINFGDDLPTFVEPKRLPDDIPLEDLVYLTSNSNVCTLRNPRRSHSKHYPTLTIRHHGICGLEMHIKAIGGYAPLTLYATLTIKKGTMSNLVWTGYASNTINLGDNPPKLVAPTGAPEWTTFEYSSATTTVCSVDRATGALTIVGRGTCTVSLTAKNFDYNNGTASASVRVN